LVVVAGWGRKLGGGFIENQIVNHIME